MSRGMTEAADIQRGIVGRDTELRLLRAPLERHTAALALVCGEAGIGKSTLVRAVREEARQRHWLVIPNDDEAIEVGYGDNDVTFLREFKRQLTHALTQRGDEPIARAEEEPPHQRVRAKVKSLLAGTELPAMTPGRRRSSELSSQLRQAAPVAVTVNLHAPDTGMARWFGKLWRDIRAEDGPVVVLAMLDEDPEPSLATAADQIIRLGPLGRDEVLVRLVAAAGQLPMRELIDYAEVIRNDLRLFDSYLRLLPLTRPTTPSPSSSARGVRDA